MSSDALEYFYGITPERLNAMKNTPPPKSTDEAWKEHYRLQEEYIEELEAEIARLEQRIKRLEEFVEQLTNPNFTRDDLPKEALLQRIKRLEEAGDRLAYWFDPREQKHFDALEAWRKAKEAKP